MIINCFGGDYLICVLLCCQTDSYYDLWYFYLWSGTNQKTSLKNNYSTTPAGSQGTRNSSLSWVCSDCVPLRDPHNALFRLGGGGERAPASSVQSKCSSRPPPLQKLHHQSHQVRDHLVFNEGDRFEWMWMETGVVNLQKNTKQSWKNL